MATNRRRVESRGMVPAPLLAVGVVLLAVGLGYLGLESKCSTLGRDIKQLEAERLRLQNDLNRARSDWAVLARSENVERALKTHGLVMTWPAAEQTVRLTEGTMLPRAYAAATRRPETPAGRLRTGVAMSHD